jgi:hypothetical protein
MYAEYTLIHVRFTHINKKKHTHAHTQQRHTVSQFISLQEHDVNIIGELGARLDHLSAVDPANPDALSLSHTSLDLELQRCVLSHTHTPTYTHIPTSTHIHTHTHTHSLTCTHPPTPTYIHSPTHSPPVRSLHYTLVMVCVWYRRWEEVRLQRVLIEYLYRDGCHSSAAQLTKDAGIEVLLCSSLYVSVSLFSLFSLLLVCSLALFSVFSFFEG